MAVKTLGDMFGRKFDIAKNAVKKAVKKHKVKGKSKKKK